MMNQMRGLLAEYGIVVAQGAIPLRRALVLILEDRDNGVRELLRELLAEMSERLRWLEERLKRYDQRIAECARTDERAASRRRTPPQRQRRGAVAGARWQRGPVNEELAVRKRHLRWRR